MTGTPESTQLDLPDDTSLPLFVYGALKPGMPAFESLRGFLGGQPETAKVLGELYVRDGLPLLFLNDAVEVRGFLLGWRPEMASDAYQAVCVFEPRKHYEWGVVDVVEGGQANVLLVRYPTKGNPQPLHKTEWQLTDDPAFGEGLAVVREVLHEIEANGDWNDWQRFFRAQMAYLLLWSILERLSALCFGPGLDPTGRVKRMHELPGMSELVAKHIDREDKVSDSRNPDATYKLNKANPKQSFNYYYQVRSNLSHRGKAVHNEVDKVSKSLSELLAITEGYLASLRDPGRK